METRPMAADTAAVPDITTPQPALRTQPVDTHSIDPTAAEALLSAAQLGQRIKRLRLKRSMGLVELGRLTGLSASFLSQLETGRVVPTLRNLARIALVFNKDLSWFFESAGHSVFRIQRRRERVRLPNGSPDPDYIAESFGILVPEGGLRPCLAEFLPGEERSGFHPERYPGVEMVYVLEGAVELRRKGEPHLLEARDVCYISGETPRSYRSAGDEAARALIISFDRDSEPRRSRSTFVS
jgi:transcriptional regulator with XRE-family HTH domain